jgi:MFS family permease
VSALVAIAIVVATAYRPPAKVATPNKPSATASAWPDMNSLVAVTVAGLMWGLLNVGYLIMFSFGPSMLIERGWSIASAASAISIVLWLGPVSVPLGGFVADRSRRPQAILVIGCILSAILMLALTRNSPVISIILAMGLISGQPAGPMMSLPARVLLPGTRAIGMGVFYTFYYGVMMLGPVIAGACATWSGSAGAAFDFGAAMLLACPLLLLAFNRIAAKPAQIE